MPAAKISYQPYDQATVTSTWWRLLQLSRRLGWRGGIDGVRGGSRSYAMQLSLFLLWRAGRGAPAFNPNGPSRHMRRNIAKLGEWAQAVDVSDSEGLVAAAARAGVPLHRPYPKEPWHVEALRPFVLGGRRGGDGVKNAQVVASLRRSGIVYPRITIREARAAGLPLQVACAILEQESGGGHNVFGHDPVRNPVRGGAVTRARYVEYLRYRRQGFGMQGVGPCQLTWWQVQDKADALGGCWLPGPNMRVGFSMVRALIKTYGLRDGLRRYNGAGLAAERYADQVVGRVRKWTTVLI